MNTRSWLRALASGIVVVVTAAVVIVVGQNAADGDPASPPAEYPTSGVVNLSPEDQQAARDEAETIASATTIPGPRTVTIEDREFELGDGFTTIRAWQSDGTGMLTVIQYTDDLGEESSLLIREDDNSIHSLRVLEHHKDLFVQFVEAAGGWPTATATPTSQKVVFGPVALDVPEGVRYYPAGLPHPTMPGVFVYRDSSGVSRLYVSASGSIVQNLILPQHSGIFASIVVALPAESD
jgi:hypothetical protein